MKAPRSRCCPRYASREAYRRGPFRASSASSVASVVLPSLRVHGGAGGWPAIIGGLNIPSETMPMNKRTGITIGGTRYFMVPSF